MDAREALLDKRWPQGRKRIKPDGDRGDVGGNQKGKGRRANTGDAFPRTASNSEGGTGRSYLRHVTVAMSDGIRASSVDTRDNERSTSAKPTSTAGEDKTTVNAE